MYGERIQERRRRGFTLTELVATAGALCALLLFLMPALAIDEEHEKDALCLANLRGLGVAVRQYADDYGGSLPGPLHAAISHGDIDQMPVLMRPFQFRRALGNILGEAAGERLSTCPVLSALNPDANFARFTHATNRTAYPTHYVLNNIGLNLDESGPMNHYRTTKPPFYFGYASSTPEAPTQHELMLRYPPQHWGRIAHPGQEWMLADGWYRPRTNPAFPELQQEGPYQSSWTGEALPNFAPHRRHAPESYVFTTTWERNAACARIRQDKSDGVTNTLFFDGHAAGVPPRTLTLMGFELLYGFSGTVNPQTPLPAQAIWR